jgi:hypothetical protein
MKFFRLISNAAFAVAITLAVIALLLLTGSYTRMQNIAVVLLIGFGFFATVGMFFAAQAAEGADGHGPSAVGK